MIINGERSLAYIAKITDIQPIPNYDRVELATINDGWRVIISKEDHFIVGDWCIYFEIDSKVPETDERFAFLAKRNFRIRTIKMCGGTLSQGLVCPIVNFPEITDKTLGEDVGKILNITYYEPGDNERKGYTTRSSLDDSLKAKHRKLYNMKIVKWLLKREWGRKLLNKLFNKRKDKRGFPKFVSKTDEERCLIGDTKISTATGRIRIADIVNKDLDVEVVCVDDNGNIEKRKVVGKQKIKCNEPLYKITYPYRHGVKKTNTVVCTGDHRFYTDEGYVQVKDLSVSDSIYMLCNSYGDDCISSVYGMLMGDSSIVFDRRCDSAPRIKFTQGEKQLDYLKYKMHIFGCDNDKIFSGSSGYCKNKTYSWHQKTDPNISVNVLSDWVRNGKKKLTENVFKYVDDRFLAFLYMDDGSLRHREDGSHPGITISTNSYSEDEIKRFVETVNSRFDFEVRFGVSKGKYPEVRIVGDNVYKFLEMVSPYMCDCMKYKTLPQYEHLVGSKPIRFSKSIRYVRTSIVSISEYSGKENYVYDITVYHNHNFFANGILTHNCENMPWVLGDGEDYVLTEKLDGTSSTYALERKPFGRYEFYVCSRNVRQENENQKCFHDYNIYWAMANKYKIKEHLKEYLNANKSVKWVCVQGESVGNVQGNPLKLDEDDLYCFNFIDSANGRYDSREGKKIVEEWGMKWVPILGIDKTQDNMDNMKKFSHGNSVVNPKVLREGIVYRSLDGKKSFKNVDPIYLEKHNQ